jgi:hypothetical protein
MRPSQLALALALPLALASVGPALAQKAAPPQAPATDPRLPPGPPLVSTLVRAPKTLTLEGPFRVQLPEALPGFVVESHHVDEDAQAGIRIRFASQALDGIVVDAFVYLAGGALDEAAFVDAHEKDMAPYFAGAVADGALRSARVLGVDRPVFDTPWGVETTSRGVVELGLPDGRKTRSLMLVAQRAPFALKLRMTALAPGVDPDAMDAAAASLFGALLQATRMRWIEGCEASAALPDDGGALPLAAAERLAEQACLDRDQVAARRQREAGAG